MSELLSMNGYGLFVWPCYLLALAILIGFAVQAVRRQRRLNRDLALLGDGE